MSRAVRLCEKCSNFSKPKDHVPNVSSFQTGGEGGRVVQVVRCPDFPRQFQLVNQAPVVKTYTGHFHAPRGIRTFEATFLAKLEHKSTANIVANTTAKNVVHHISNVPVQLPTRMLDPRGPRRGVRLPEVAVVVNQGLAPPCISIVVVAVELFKFFRCEAFFTNERRHPIATLKLVSFNLLFVVAQHGGKTEPEVRSDRFATIRIHT